VAPEDGSDAVNWLICCREILLPIWERWTDGNPALRRALESEESDPGGLERSVEKLSEVVSYLTIRAPEAATGREAASYAGMAVMAVLIGEPFDLIRLLTGMAVEADTEAMTVADTP
jgi:hypothetical protein